MSSLPSPNRSLSRRTVWPPIAVSVLAAFVALSRAHAFMTSAPAVASGQSPVAVAAPTPFPVPEAGRIAIVIPNTSTCHVIMQCLPGSLAATPSTADKSSIVMIDVDEVDVMVACSHSNSTAIPIPGGKPR